MKKRKVCIITGSRAEWGLFYPLAARLKAAKDEFILQIIVTGSHLSLRHGFTYREIQRDGFRIDRAAGIPLALDTKEAIAISTVKAMGGLVKALRILKPDIVFLLGDRFETFAAAAGCVFLKIPIAHIHGGELTEGSLDDVLRHSITKMSQLHFVSTEEYRKRVIQMGEEPSRVFNVGSPGLDNIKSTKLLGKKAFEKITNFKLGDKNILVTFNPSTAEPKALNERQLNNLLKVLSEMKDARVIFTRSNPDIYSNFIMRKIQNYVRLDPDKRALFASMGRILYLSALRFMGAVAGNSSSGIIEVPSFGIPTINIGDRQKGRARPLSVIDSDGSLASIKRSFRKAFSPDFRKKCAKAGNIYGSGGSSEKILNILRNNVVGIKKRFFDVDYDIPKTGARKSK